MNKRVIVLLGGESTQCIAFAKAFSELGYSIVIVSEHSSSYSKSTVVNNEVICAPHDFTERNLSALIGGTLENVALILPMEDIWQESFLKGFCDSTFAKLRPLIDIEVLRTVANKRLLMQLAEDLGVPTPRTYTLKELQKYSDLDHKIIVKPVSDSGARGFVISSDTGTLISGYDYLMERDGDALIQDYLPQDGRQFKYTAFCWDGVVISFSVIEKLEYFPVSGGSSVLCKAIVDSTVKHYADEICHKVVWSGMIDFDFIEDVPGQRICLLEVNPRPPACVGVAFESGVNFAINFDELLSAPSQPTFTKFHPKRAIEYQYFTLRMFRFLFFGLTKDSSSRSYFIQECPTGEKKIFLNKLLENLKKLSGSKFKKKFTAN